MLKRLLIESNFRYNKRLGQNFITDKNLLQSIVLDSGIDSQDKVLEIGAGGGSLTKVLCDYARKVYAFEIDRRLEPILKQILSDKDNYQLHFKDILKVDDQEILSIIGNRFKVVSNLPYYITTPIIMRFLESDYVRPVNMTFMMQKEVAQRICAKENTPEYGAITLAVNLRGNAKITRYVDKRAFYPIPKVDSAIVRIDTSGKYNEYDINSVIKLIKVAFAMRRKTLLNNLIIGYNLTREQAKQAMDNAHLEPNVRGESLNLEKFLVLSQQLPKH